jgi:uncharacterized membrane protein YoaK (UPF0700 family)
LAICVASIAGYLDAYALRTLGVFVSFMSGNNTVAGLRNGEGHSMSALAPALAIPWIGFLIGGLTQGGQKEAKIGLGGNTHQPSQ